MVRHVNAVYAALLCSLAFATAACGDKVNDTLLVVNATLAELTAGQDVDRIDINAQPARGASANRSFTLTTSSTLPVTLGLVPVGSPQLDVRINVSGWKGDQLVVAQEANVTLVPNEAKQLLIVLERRCSSETGIACEPDTTCRAGACVATNVFAGELQPYPSTNLDAAPAPDGGKLDAASDPDAGAPDAPLPEPTEGDWEREDAVLPGGVPASFNLTSISVVNTETLVVVGYAGGQGVAFRGSSGSNWERMPLPTGTPPLYSVWSNAADNVWAVGANGTIVHSTSGDFEAVQSGTTAVLTSVYGFGQNDGWAVGANGTILRGGNGAWARVSAPAVTGNLNAIAGVSAESLWVVGAEGGVFRGGEGTEWARVPQSLSRNLLYAVWAVSERDVWAVGDRLALHWDGVRFTSTNIPLETALSVWSAASNDVWAVGRPTAGGSPIARWTGTQWNTIESPVPGTLQNVRGASASMVMAVGNMGTIVRFVPMQ